MSEKLPHYPVPGWRGVPSTASDPLTLVSVAWPRGRARPVWLEGSDGLTVSTRQPRGLSAGWDGGGSRVGVCVLASECTGAPHPLPGASASARPVLREVLLVETTELLGGPWKRHGNRPLPGFVPHTHRGKTQEAIQGTA